MKDVEELLVHQAYQCTGYVWFREMKAQLLSKHLGTSSSPLFESIIAILNQTPEAANVLSITNDARNRLASSYKAYREKQKEDIKVLEDNPLSERMMSCYQKEWGSSWRIVNTDVCRFNTAVMLLTPTVTL